MRPNNHIRALGVGVILLAAPLLALSQGTRGLAGEGSTYFEFGTVASLGDRSVVIQTLDAAKSKVQQSFALTAETRADLVHVGDPVEVIYTEAGGTLTVHRLLTLYAGIPKAGPPAMMHRSGRGSTRPVTAAAATPQKITVDAEPRLARAETPVSLGVNNAPRAAAVIPVPLGGATSTRPIVPVTVRHEMPAEECNRSSAEWPSQPLRIAVIDFRYPTEKEEAHDVGRTGGGSGTAVADLVFARLSSMQTGFAIDRGDRRRLDKSDFAGAARLGRQLGADAVLAGTFAAVDEVSTDEYGPATTKAYELHAGLVDTCTGQLLMKLSSESCMAAAGPGASGCVATVSAKAAENPEAHGPAFAAPIDALLSRLETNGSPAATVSEGVITGSEGRTATFVVSPQALVKVGDQVAIHASRLVKNPSTYTLQDLQDEEIGRVVIEQMHGSSATGTFTGDIPPKPGDTVQLLSSNRELSANQ